MAFDGIVTKAICSELSNLVGARIDKIFQPNKNNVVIGMYNQGKNYALNICTEQILFCTSFFSHPFYHKFEKSTVFFKIFFTF